MLTNVAAVTPIPSRSRSAGLRIAQLSPALLGAAMDPFLMCDCFWMAEPYFPPHPHAGMSAVTYMLPESAGGFVNRDSQGDRSLILPGALHWTEAASGIVHEEVPIERGQICQGLQIFVNLPSTLKTVPPARYHLEPADASVVQSEGAAVRVLAGALGKVQSPVQPRTECALWDATLSSHATLTLPLPDGWQAFGILSGGALIDGAGAVAAVADGEVAAVRFTAGDDVLRLHAAAPGARLVLLAGRPLREPLAFGGPFVMNTEQQLLRARMAYEAGEMGHLTPSF